MQPQKPVRETAIHHPPITQPTSMKQFYQHHGWDFALQSSHLSPSTDIDAYEQYADMKCPEMVFLPNFLKIRHNDSAIVFVFDTAKALLGCKHAFIKGLDVRPDFLPTPLQVQTAALWKDVAVAELEHVHADFDWTYTSIYQGHLMHQLPILKSSTDVNSTNLTGDNVLESSSNDTTLDPIIPKWVATDKTIDYNMLRRPDPIQFFQSLILYEDELHDNGVSQMSIKLRVMPTCFFVLLRVFLRVDGVVVRVRDTRLFHVFGTHSVLRETKLQEVKFTMMAELGLPTDTSSYKNADVVGGMLKPTLLYTEELIIPQ